VPVVTEPLTGSRIVLTHILYSYTVIEFKCMQVPECIEQYEAITNSLGFRMMDGPQNDNAERSYEINTSKTEHD
jgi:hypothetical protein